jgi:hypothetical protein
MSAAARKRIAEALGSGKEVRQEEAVAGAAIADAYTAPLCHAAEIRINTGKLAVT